MKKPVSDVVANMGAAGGTGALGTGSGEPLVDVLPDPPVGENRTVVRPSGRCSVVTHPARKTTVKAMASHCACLLHETILFSH